MSATRTTSQEHTMMSDLEHRFAFHAAATEEKRDLHTSMRQACLSAALVIDEKAPNSREKSLAITKLEEAMMWANAAVARHPQERE